MIRPTITKQLLLLSAISFSGMCYSQNWDTQHITKPQSEKDSAEKVLLATNDGTLAIGAEGSLRVFQGAFLTAKNEITNLGTGDNFIIESDANLLQINESAVNTGNITVERYVSDMNNVLSGLGAQMDYVYWSSPVLGQKTKGAQGFSPGTPSNRFYTYRESNDYFYETGDLTFVPGKGYAVRAETGINTATGQNYVNGYAKTYKFQGTPNNGLITINVKKSPNSGTNGEVIHGFNMLGNPYPSNIHFDQLYDLNRTVIYPTVWFWTNNSYTQNQQAQGYGANNYAVYNRTGGAAATSSDLGGSNVNKPTGVISVGQGFIIQVRDVGDATVTFQNTYGAKAIRVATTADFYSRESLQKDRFWLNLISPDNLVNSQLIGYMAGATNDFEQDYDAELLSFSSDVFYSVLGDKNLQIQGKSPFTSEDKVTLGANIFSAGTYTIALEQPEGVFNSAQAIYLKDKETGKLTNLSQNSYTFQSVKGVSTGRFEIIYKPETVLGTEAVAKEEVVVYRKSGDFVVQAQSKEITALQVFDMSGKLIYKAEPNSTRAVIRGATLSNGMYIIKVDQNGLLTSKKIIK